MFIWSYSRLYRSVHNYSTLFLKHGGQISLEVTGKRRNKGSGQEIPASDTFNCKKAFKSKEVKFNFIELIRDKEDKADL